MAKLQDGTRIYGTANVDTALNVNTYFTANASQVKIATPLSANGSTGTAGQILVSGGANNAYWGSTTPLYNYSAQFNGSSTFLTTPTSATFNLNAVDWTIECWFYCTATPPATATNLIQSYQGTNNWQPYVGIGLNANLTFQITINAVATATTQTFTLNSWNHVALVRSGGVVKFYLNGVATSVSVTSDITSSNLNWFIGKVDNAQGGGGYVYYYTGYLSNVRIVKGVAVYTGAFTVPTSPLTTSQSSGTNIAAVSSSQVSLLTCNALTLTDASPNAFAITNVGPVVASATTYPTSFPQSAVYVPTTALTAIRQQFTGDGSTTQFNISGGYTPNTISVFVNGVLARNGSDVTVTSGSFITFTGITPPNGSLIDVIGTVPTTYSSITPVSYSVGFNGTSQYLTMPITASGPLDLSSNTTYTIEAWVNWNSIATGKTVWDFTTKNAGATSYYYELYINASGKVVWEQSNLTGVMTSVATSASVVVGTWYHVAIVRNGSGTNNITIYLNGVASGVGTYSSADTTYTEFMLGCIWYNNAYTQFFNGYLSNFRITKGLAVYTNNFTVPSSPLAITQSASGAYIQAITGTQTSLLTCNAPTIIDGSTNAFTITNNGSAPVSTAVVPTFTNIVMNSTSADAYNSSTGNLGILFNNTTNRQMLNAFGFQFKDDGGIITPTNKTKVSFYNEAANTWTVPAGVTRIFVKMWGAGGGGGSYGGWRQGAQAGGGGFTHAMFNVVPGEVIQIRPGGRGTDKPGATTAYPDGGGASTAGTDNQYCGNGGGSSSIRIPSISATVYALYAGGGGGGGACLNMAVNNGGAGGGLIGQPGGRSGNYTTTQYGLGGTQSAGGAGGTGAFGNGAAGTAGQGATHPSAYVYGGGGGGGYYGGGSGAYNNSNSMGGGGGGSGYVHPSAIFGATYTGSYRTPANSQDSDLQPDNALQYGHGGDESAQGGPGVVVFYY